jgi:hypothetical protein
MDDLGDVEAKDHLEHLGVIILGAKDMTSVRGRLLTLYVFHE